MTLPMPDGKGGCKLDPVKKREKLTICAFMIRSVSIILLLLCCGCERREQKPSADEQFYIDKMAANMRQASTWIIQHGIETYAAGGQTAISRKLMDEWAAQLWVKPAVGTERELAAFRIKGRGIYYDIQCLIRLTNNNAIFEYWHIMITGKDWAGIDRECKFIVTQAERIDGVRKIIHQSDKFFPSYKINESASLKLPLDDLQLLYDLKAWQFPECFPDSDIKNWEIGIDREGRYVRVPAKDNPKSASPTKS